VAQDLLNQLKTGIETIDTQETSSSKFGNDKPSIHNNTGPVVFPVANTFSMTKYLWETSDRIDAASYYAADEMAIKMISKKGVYNLFG